MLPYLSHAKKTRTWWWVALFILPVAMLGLSIWLAGPSPPRRIKMATGLEGGGYDTFGQQYRKQLGKMGLEVELVNTQGSIENLELLARGEVDVAFVQGGTFQQARIPNQEQLRGLVAVYLEPLWVFYRGTLPVPTISDFLGDFTVVGPTAAGLASQRPPIGPAGVVGALITGRAVRGPTISVGPTGSGTEAVARLLLKVHGITEKNARFVYLEIAEARKGLEEGSVDVALMVSTYRDKDIQNLLAQKDIQLMNFKRHDIAYARQFPYLNSVKLAEGLFDLKQNIPREEKILLAPAALLVCREDLHPRVIEQILKAARTIHSHGSQIDPPNQFPTLDGVDVVIHKTADTYMKSGESFLTRLLPYWGVRLVLQLRILILPLLAVWLPFVKILPMIYNYRVNRILKRHYAALREAESAIAQAHTSEELRARLQAFEHLGTDMEALSRKVPAGLQRDVYHWRLHVAVVRTEALDRLKRMEEDRPPEPTGQPLVDSTPAP
jgi:TRAP-type uncharacterized transport system substrate-binding protein